MWMIAILLIYFAVLFGISRWTGRRATNASFYRADRQAPWPVVAFGMVGASISGITFVSVPGMVLHSQMTYLQTCMGFIVGYLVVSLVLLPLYYRLNLTSIYSFLGQRLGPTSHKTGSWFFLLSKMAGASIKFYVVCMILQLFVFEPMGVPFAVTAVGLVLLIWLYTRQGGLKTLVWTDSVQTLCLFTALLLIIYKVLTDLGLTWGAAVETIGGSPLSRVFVWDDWLSSQHFWKQFLSGAFIVIVMTGLDQDMMQKNLTCRTLRDAQKDMCTYGVAFLPANFLFLALGVLLTLWFQQQGLTVPAKGDDLLPEFVTLTSGLVPADAPAHGLSLGLSSLTSCFFVLGIVAASFSSADSALASMTTIFCVDIMERTDDECLRKRTHLAMCAVFVLFVLMFRMAGSSSLIDTIYTIVGYTYGPLLGLFAFCLFGPKPSPNTHHPSPNPHHLTPVVCIASPLICYAIQAMSAAWLDYHFGYELLMLNGLLTFVGLWAVSLSVPLRTR